MSFVQEFKEFAMKGNVIDLAVWVIIGTAFGKIVTSLVGDIVMPGIIDPLVNSLGSDWKSYTLWHMKIGAFAGSVIDFIIIALVIFLMIKAINAAQKKISKKNDQDGKKIVESLSKEQKLLTEIRDLLRKWK